ncbi:uncharacterized protein [Littorina saxatilis]|uniref:Chitin-binding type-2 domain-containing protein n=1 Tax=Littorina saxatilis TaxID=31220 RepID=A0AAN9BZ89_9CAEN
MVRHNTIPVLSLLAIFLTAGQGIQVSLTRLSSLYLPTYAQNGSVSYPFPSATVEKVAFEPLGKVIYGVGKGIIHVISASDAMNLASVDHFIVPNLELTDVQVCEDGVFITYRNDFNKQRGGVLVYDLYDPFSKDMDLLHDIPMGSSPDMVSPTKDCTLVVAIENEGFIENGRFYDPPGGVGIIRFPKGIDLKPEVKILNFTAFDKQFNQLSKQGVRWVFRGNNNSFSDNIEPESITFNADYSIAYIGLQENNAIAVVDMATDTITAIHGLGFKTWGELDPSDKDGGVNIKNWPVYGMYQPDSIQFVRWNNQDYIITANEGDAQEYGAPVNFAEETRGKNIDPADISPIVSKHLRDALQDDAELGRLTISSVDGRNAQGKFERFYTYGARSFSIWRASDMQRVYDSGSELEKKMATFRRDILNSNAVPNRYLDDTVDTRSDNRGPETESLAVGEMEGHLLIFVGNERGSSIAVYSVAKGGLKPTFQTLFTGIPRDNARKWRELFDARELFAIDPEFMRFFSPSEGLADYPVLLVAGSESGTVSTFKVEVKNPTKPKGCPLTPECTINQPCNQPHQCKHEMDMIACMGNCQRYALCIYGVYLPMKCQKGMYFDELKGRCVRGLCPAEAVARPSTTVRPVPVSAPGKTTPTYGPGSIYRALIGLG